MIGKHVADSKAVSHINHNMIINDSLQTLADWFFWYCSPIRLHHLPTSSPLSQWRLLGIQMVISLLRVQITTS